MAPHRPNEGKEEGGELRSDAERVPHADEGEIDSRKPRSSIRWVQLAYDLEQYGDADPEERGEVF